MPFSIAACRTVLPFSTVTCRPSIVSVTVSISFDHINEFRGTPDRLGGALDRTWQYAFGYSSLDPGQPYPSKGGLMDAVRAPARFRSSSGCRGGVSRWRRSPSARSSCASSAARRSAPRAADASRCRRDCRPAVPAGAVSVPVLPFRTARRSASATPSRRWPSRSGARPRSAARMSIAAVSASA